VIRQLTLFDLDNAMKIARMKERSAGTVPVSDIQFEELHQKYFESNGINYALGYFEDNQLVSWIALGLHENKARGKFWYISFLYTSKFHNSFNFNNTEIGYLIKAAFSLAEEQQFYEYYYTVSERVQNVYERQWARNTFMQTGRYELVTLAEIEPNTQPSVDLYWRLLGQETRPDKMVIKKRILNNDFRK